MGDTPYKEKESSSLLYCISSAAVGHKKASKLLKQETEGQLHLIAPFSSLFFTF